MKPLLNTYFFFFTSLFIFPLFAQQQIGQSINGQGSGTQLGKSVALSADGSRMAIGAPGRNNVGQVTVYDLVNDNWMQAGAFIDGLAANDNLGWSVALSHDGNIMAIGAPFISNFGGTPGYVQVYEWVEEEWMQVGLNISGSGGGDRFGWSVDLSADANRLAVGAPNNDDNGNNAGQVKIYDWVNDTWTQIGQAIDGEMMDDQSGWSLALSADGNKVAIGAPQNDGNGDASGQTRVFELIENTWTQMGQDIDGAALGDEAGTSVSLSSDGGVLAIGVPNNDDNGNNAGYIQVYEWTGVEWAAKGIPIHGERVENGTGQSVVLSADGNRVAIGEAFNDEGPGINTGQVRLFNWQDGAWRQFGLDINGVAEGDEAGTAVALSADGNCFAIGAPKNNESAGQVRSFKMTGDIWSQLGQDINGIAAGDESGWSVHCSSNGSHIAIGARYEDSNGDDAGGVRVFNLMNGNWEQVGQALFGEEEGDHFGHAVSISADGTRIAIAAFENMLPSGGPGYIKVYDLINDNWEQAGPTIHGTTNQFGHSIALSGIGTRLAVGLPSEGRVRIYELIIGSWIPIGQDLLDEIGGDMNGHSIALSTDGDRVVIGAPRNDGNGLNAGHVRVYTLHEQNWFQVGPDINGEAAGDQSGWAVACSASGNRIAIGAPYNADNGKNSGHVRVFDLIGASWIQVGQDIDGETGNDESGWHVAISADGSRVVIGARRNAGNGLNAGQVRVYELINETWVQIGVDINGEALGDFSGYANSICANSNRLVVGVPFNDGNGSQSGHTRIFELTQMQPLFLHSIALTGTTTNHQNILQWTSSSSTTTTGFNIQHSTNGQQWQTINFVKNKENSQYKYTDFYPLQGTNYYRIQYLDELGQFAYSNTISLSNSSPNTIQVFPNPTHKQITITGIENGQVSILDILGRVRWKGALPVSHLDISHLEKGIYFLRLYTENQWFSQQLVKND